MENLSKIASRCFRTSENNRAREACCNAVTGRFVLDILWNFHIHPAEAASSVLLGFAENLNNDSSGLRHFPVGLHYSSRQPIETTKSFGIQGRHEYSYFEKSSEFFVTNTFVVSK